jgi:hypothetical protein
VFSNIDVQLGYMIQLLCRSNIHIYGEYFTIH